MYICVYVCMSLSKYVCVCMYVRMYVFNVCMYLFNVYVYVCVYVCVYLIYVCM